MEAAGTAEVTAVDFSLCAMFDLCCTASGEGLNASCDSSIRAGGSGGDGGSGASATVCGNPLWVRGL
eukprot:1316081-Prymnesium_polylepis.1